MRSKTEYTEISRAQVTKTRNIVISHCSRGGFTVAQQVTITEDDGKQTNVFMKGASHIDDIQGLYNLRDAVNLAIKVAEQGTDGQEDDGWDD